ncbi:unnamed protein product [Didymodactylos carnosus]|uniref:Uncharacterized protein n=1 Tax=Didymodactylos carnosus TaxID=1234261 RepID=A0A8S2XVE1_9BILA|nr:unnamed protein product [Didymodactylos carnosus]
MKNSYCCKAVSQSMNISDMHFDSVKSALYRVRNSYIPNLPSTLSEVDIPPKWQLDNAGNQFLRYLTPMPVKVLIFVTDRALKELASSEHWNVDGTFKTTP